ncbi:MAG: hypothetical protein HC785_11505 [Calothrix sp. CSU_2_0]|nr:hypothetical protein [Calothrix sp. CSU_2_0]
MKVKCDRFVRMGIECDHFYVGYRMRSLLMVMSVLFFVQVRYAFGIKLRLSQSPVATALKVRRSLFCMGCGLR